MAQVKEYKTYCRWNCKKAEALCMTQVLRQSHYTERLNTWMYFVGYVYFPLIWWNLFKYLASSYHGIVEEHRSCANFLPPSIQPSNQPPCTKFTTIDEIICLLDSAKEVLYNLIVIRRYQWFDIRFMYRCRWFSIPFYTDVVDTHTDSWNLYRRMRRRSRCWVNFIPTTVEEKGHALHSGTNIEVR